MLLFICQIVVGVCNVQNAAGDLISLKQHLYARCMMPYDKNVVGRAECTMHCWFIVIVGAMLTLAANLTLVGKDTKNIFDGSELNAALTSSEVFYVMIATIFAVSSLIFDFAVDIILVVRNSLKHRKSSRKHFNHELISRMLLLAGVITPPILMVASMSSTFKCALYIVWLSMQNVFLAAAVIIMLLKSTDEIICPVSLCCGFLIYGIGQVLDIFNQISLVAPKSDINAGYTSFRLIGISILGLILVGVAIRVAHVSFVLRLDISKGDAAGIMLITTLFAGAIATEVVFYLYPDESGTSRYSSRLVVIYNQYMSVVLTLCIHMIIRRLALLELSEKKKMLDKAHLVLKSVFEPLKFLNKYLKVVCTAEDLQDPSRSRLLNYMQLACSMSLRGFSEQRDLMLGALDYLRALQEVACVPTLEPLNIEDMESIDGGSVDVRGLTNADLESELGVSSLANLEGVKLKTLEKDYSILDRLQGLAVTSIDSNQAASPHPSPRPQALMSIDALMCTAALQASPTSRKKIFSLGDDIRFEAEPVREDQEVQMTMAAAMTPQELAGMKGSLDKIFSKYSSQAAWGSLVVNTNNRPDDSRV